MACQGQDVSTLVPTLKAGIVDVSTLVPMDIEGSPIVLPLFSHLPGEASSLYLREPRRPGAGESCELMA